MQNETPAFSLLGVRIDAIQIPDVIARMEEWIIKRDGCRYIAVTGMHGVTEAHHDAKFKEILNSAGLIVADGMPLVWMARRKGFVMPRRVYGPELLEAFCAKTSGQQSLPCVQVRRSQTEHHAQSSGPCPSA